MDVKHISIHYGYIFHKFKHMNTDSNRFGASDAQEMNSIPMRRQRHDGHDARAVANKILQIAWEQGKTLTLMQLIKLVYLSHGFWLSYTGGQPLTSTHAEAWQYGPVHPDVYNAFKRFRDRDITALAQDPQIKVEYTEQFSDRKLQTMQAVVKGYGDLHAFVLSDKMHEPGTPWSITVDNYGYYKPIDNNLIRQHFDEIG